MKSELDIKFDRSLEMRSKSHDLIPGGCHTYAKGDDQFPELAPAFIAKGQGCRVWDVDGNEFIEYGSGLRSVTLGHAYPQVVEAAHREMLKGTNFTRPSIIELQAAEKLQSLIKSANMIKFAKNGSDVTTAAVKLARAYTGRDLIAICADQPFFSIDDWFIGSTEMPAGVPEQTRSLTVKFRYNDIGSLKSLFASYPGQIACVIMEAATASLEPEGIFLNQVQELCNSNKSIFILDEMITGFRWDLHGAQNTYGIVPDLSTFGKGMANGFSVAALVGKRELMELGGIKHEGERVFLLSTTHGAETHSLAAAIETMRIYEQKNVIQRLYESGTRLKEGINRIAEKYGIQEYFKVIGRSCNLVYMTKDRDKRPSQQFRTLFLQELIKEGIIAPSFVVSFSHTNDVIDRTIDACSRALKIYSNALEEGIDKYLSGRPVKPVNRRTN